MAIDVTAGELVLPFRDEAGARVRFERLMAAHQRRVFRTAYRLLGRCEDAQDATQEVFLRLLKNLDSVGEDPSGWLYRVTVNVCNDFYRRTPPLEISEEIRAGGVSAEEALTMDERKRLLMDGLQTLPERERAAVVLRDIEGLSTAEVARIMGVEEVTVRSQICVARVKLAKYVRERR